jgi:hypothetical protein
MTIVITTKEPRADWNNLNVKRVVNPIEFEISEYRFYANGRHNDDVSEIKAEDIVNIVITY